jgi:hypothetical protein
MALNGLSTEHETDHKSVSCWRALVCRALGRAGVSQKRAASDLGITEGQLSRQLSGAEHLSFWRMRSLPPEFWQELLTLLCEYHEICIGQSIQERTDAEIGKLIREAVGKVVAK